MCQPHYGFSLGRHAVRQKPVLLAWIAEQERQNNIALAPAETGRAEARSSRTAALSIHLTQET
jgi:hypothetical protein